MYVTRQLGRFIWGLTETDSQGKQYYWDRGVRKRLRGPLAYARLNVLIDTKRPWL